MKRRSGTFVSVVVLATAGLLLGTVTASAQNVGIAGRVTDTTGGVLPGVTVEASSPALIEQARTVVSDGQGLYTIIDLRPGEYTVTFTIPGFTTVVREGITLSGAMIATVNAELRVGGVEESITVTGETPDVDIRNVVQQEVLDTEIREALPTGRSQLHMSELIPAVTVTITGRNHDVGGTNINRGSSQTHGSLPGDYSMQFDGAPMTIAGSGSQGLRNVDPLEIQEFVFELSGISAETESGGVRTNLIPKEGGNDFAGSFLASYTSQDLQNDNFDQELRDLGLPDANAIQSLRDFNGSFGGPIVQDRAWFFLSARTWGIADEITGAYHAIDPLSFTFNPRLGAEGNADLNMPGVLDSYHHAVSGRLTYQITPRNKLAAYYSYQPRGQDGLLMSGTWAYEGAWDSKIRKERFAQLKWTSPITSRLLFEATWTDGYNSSYLDGTRPGLAYSDVTGVIDAGTGIYYRSSIVGYGEYIGYQPSTKAALSYVTGSHTAKFGVDFNWGYQSWKNRSVNGNLRYIFFNGRPIQAQLENGPWTSRQNFRKFAFFAQDQWTVDRLTVNAGIRYDQHVGSIPGDENVSGPSRWAPYQTWLDVDDVPNWRDFSPRLGLAYDLTGSGRTALKVSLNRYVVKEGTAFAAAINPLLFNQYSNHSWFDPNGDRIVQLDELGPTNNTNFATVAPLSIQVDDAIREGWGVRMYNWEFAGGVQHQLLDGLSVEAQYTRRSFGNFSVSDNRLVGPGDFDEFCVTAPTDTRLGGVSGSEVCGLYDLNPAKLGQVETFSTAAENFGEWNEMWQGIDLTMNASFDRYTLSGGLSSGTVGNMRNACFTVDSPQGDVLGDRAGRARPVAPGGHHCEFRPPWRNNVKFHGTVSLPWDFDLALTFLRLPGPEILADQTYRNGNIGSAVRFLDPSRTAFSGGSVNVPLLAPGEIYNEPLYQMDARLAKVFPAGGVRSRITLDIANLFNANTVLLQNNAFGSNWLRPSQILIGRLFKLGFSIDF